MEFFRDPAPWYLAGPFLALTVVGLHWVTNQPLGATGSFVATLSWARRPGSPPGWRAFLLLGTLLGGLFSALLAVGPSGLEASFANGTFDARFGDSLGAKALVLGGGGFLIGYGARTAGGCTSGHGICGMSALSTGSIVATATFMAVANGMAWAFGG